MNQFLKYLSSLIFSQQKDLKLNVLLEALKKNASEDLFIQIELYEKCQLEDEQEAFSKNGLNFNSPQEIFNAICLKTQNFQNVSKKFLELLQFIHQMSEFHGEQHNSSLQMENLFSILTDTARDLMLKNQRNRMIKLYSDACIQTEQFGPNLRTLISVQNDLRKLKANAASSLSKDSKLVPEKMSQVFKFYFV